MEELQIAICEDNQEEGKRLLSLIETNGVPAQISLFESGEAFLKEYQTGVFDLIFMDIYMEGISGIETVQHIRETDTEIPIAFTTASLDHALDGYRLDVAKYIEKPATQKAVDAMLKLAQEKKEHQPWVSFLLNGKTFFIPVNQLLYVEQKAHYLMFYFLGSKKQQIKGKLDELEPQLADFPFFRCHKSYLTNLSFVTDIDQKLMLFHMKEGNNVYIRRENFKKAKEAWVNWLFTATGRGKTQNK